MLRPRPACFMFAVLRIGVGGRAQPRRRHFRIPDLQGEAQAAPRLYVERNVWVYPTDSMKDDKGNAVGQCKPAA